MGPGQVAVADAPPAEILEPPYGYIVRTAADRLRLLLATLVLGVALALAAADRGTSGLEEELLRQVERMPESAAALLVGVVQVTAVLAPLANLAALIWRRRLRILAQVLVAAGVAAVATTVAEDVLDRPPVRRPPAIEDARYLAGSDFPSGPYLAAVTATLVVMAPWLPRRWRHVLITCLVVLALARVASGTTVAWNVLLAVAVGGFAGTLLLALVGSPNRRPHGADVLAGLARAGITVRTLQAAAQRGLRVTAYRAVTADGRHLRVELASPDDHEAGMLVRTWRWIRLRDPGHRSPLASLRRLVEHEALVSLLASAGGVRTPRLVAVGEAGRGGHLLAFEDVDAVPLSALSPQGLTDDVLRGAWGQVAALARARVAHRDLRLDSLLLDRDGRVWITDFEVGEPAPEDAMLNGDVAQLLCDAALAVGATRSARTAVDVLGPDAVAAALPRLQPLALPAATRRSFRRRRTLLAELRTAVQEATGVDEVPYEDLERLKPKTVLGVLMVAVALYVLLPQLGDLGTIADELSRADWGWCLAAVAAAAVTYVGAALTLTGSVPDRVRFAPALAAQVAASFVSKVTPGNVGGMALNARFLQKHGVDTAVALTGVGLSAVAGFVVHVGFLVVVAVWVGRAGTATGFSLPVGRTVVLVALGTLAVAALALLVPSTRRLATDRLLPPLRRSGAALRELIVRPGKLSALLGGAALVTVGYLVALICSLQAFGGGVPLASVALVYLAGTALANAAPTPGGLGAVEAALVAGLTGIGVGTEVAVSAVLTFRLLTFWLPVVPGWLAFVMLQRRMEL